MLRANGDFVQVEVKASPTKGFAVSGGQLIEGLVMSVGDNVEHLKKGYTVLFDRHKTMVHSIDGVDNFFVKEETILAYEK